MLHCLDISQTCAASSTIIVRSPDTDVLVLLARYIKDIQITVLFDTGTGNKRRLLNVNQILQTKGEAVCSVLPAVHCFTGCDTTSAFVRRGKVAPVKLVEKSQEYRLMFAKFGQEQVCSDDLYKEAEQFVCVLYGKPKYTEVNKLRYDSFLNKCQGNGDVLDTYCGIDMSLLPPCQSALTMHVKRVNYQVYVWLHSHENNPALPNVEESGWQLNNDNTLEYKWSSGNIVPQELVEILCRTPLPEDEENDDDEGAELSNMADIFYEEDSDDDEE